MGRIRAAKRIVEARRRRAVVDRVNDAVLVRVDEEAANERSVAVSVVPRWRKLIVIAPDPEKWLCDAGGDGEDRRGTDLRSNEGQVSSGVARLEDGCLLVAVDPDRKERLLPNGLGSEHAWTTLFSIAVTSAC